MVFEFYFQKQMSQLNCLHLYIGSRQLRIYKLYCIIAYLLTTVKLVIITNYKLDNQ
jgi:hypothetical protein